MTPQERQLVSDLFDRLARLEPAPRDAEAERSIADGLSRAPNAIYPLVQTVLLQDEALRRADARIRALEGGGEQAAGGGFLDNMRNALFPARDSAATSVPTVRPGGGDSRWGPGPQAAPASAAQPGAAPQGGSFLGTAAASAAGVIGGALLFQSISSMFGNRSHAFAGDDASGRSPWGNDASGSDLARDAGVNDIGRGGASGDTRSAGLFDGGDDSGGLDSGGDFGGGSDGGGSDA